MTNKPRTKCDDCAHTLLPVMQMVAKCNTCIHSDIITDNFKRKVTKWKPKGGTYPIGSYSHGNDYKAANRETEAQARRAGTRRTYSERLEALVIDLDGEAEFKHGDRNWCIFRTKQGMYNYYCVINGFSEETVYMTKDCAAKICDMLNNGEVDLYDD